MSYVGKQNDIWREKEYFHCIPYHEKKNFIIIYMINFILFLNFYF